MEDMALILSELERRVIMAGGQPAVFSVFAFSQAYPEIWAAVMQKLGIKQMTQLRYLKSGSKGSAYALGAKEVIKFTTDKNEVEAMAKAGNDSEFIVHVNSAFWFPCPGKGLIGCIRQERLQPAATDWKNFGDLATFYFAEVLHHAFDPLAVDQFKAWAVRRLSQHAQSSVEAQLDAVLRLMRPRKAVEAADTTRVSRKAPAPKDKLIDTPMEPLVLREDNPDKPFGEFVNDSVKMPTEEMFEWFRGLCKELQSKGIAFYDLNGGNIMKRGGVHVALDLGHSVVKNPPSVDDSLVKQFEQVASAVEAMLEAIGDAPQSVGPAELVGKQNIWDALAKKLGLDANTPLRKIGEGSNGTAYLGSDGNVLKITKDKSEAQAMQKLVGHKSHYIVDVFRVLNIADKLFALSMEKLAPPDTDWKNFFVATEKYFSMEEPVSDETVAAFAAQWQKEAPAAAMVHADGFDDWGDINPGDDINDDKLDNLNVKTGVKWPGPFDEKKVHWLQGLAHELARYDIKFGDMNTGNIMKRGGDHVVIDLGMSRTNSAPQLERLED